ncbi:MAG: DUF2442 domain-containing protein [Proteobacteria bacterium]|nr:DUF2442 domain-containing protein [Desulfobacteraceae bacterium]MBU2522174.1 DUF2442 domain-containing protein [Pseudomonadota bacterium]MBU3980447.1 DUF2442 domain-containing protein [Pseudomonadota bacterium]MBU4013075.1 DUF2442 domain-containing protein [Pseudomonadota bacterium]MBU4068078.1 DUF2442 domain-containing protein [Pseudomonadota bacterium]
MHKIINVTVLQNYKVKLEYADGENGIADLSHLVGKGVFILWNDYKAFQNVKIGLSGELLWNDQVDLCPDSLYLQITNKEPEDLFPSLKRKVAYA